MLYQDSPETYIIYINKIHHYAHIIINKQQIILDQINHTIHLSNKSITKSKNKRKKCTQMQLQFDQIRFSASETAEQFLWSGSGGAIFCCYFLRFEKILPALSFNRRSLFFCRLVVISNLVFYFLYVSCFLRLQLLLRVSIIYVYGWKPIITRSHSHKFRSMTNAWDSYRRSHAAASKPYSETT